MNGTSEAEIRAAALLAAADDFRARAQAIEDSAGEKGDPLAHAIWSRCGLAEDGSLTLDDPQAIARVAYEACATLLGFVEVPHEPPRFGWAARRWSCYMGRFPVPDWLFDHSPRWLHSAADWLGGVEPSPWIELRDRVGYSRPALLIYRIVKGRDRV